MPAKAAIGRARKTLRRKHVSFRLSSSTRCEIPRKEPPFYVDFRPMSFRAGAKTGNSIVNTFDVAIVGGGVIGLSAAFELSGAGLRVVVLDRQEMGREASWAAAGMLAPGPESNRTAALVSLAKQSFALYPEFTAAVEEASRKTTSFTRKETLEVFPGCSGELAREEFIAEYRRHGIMIEPIGIDAARKMEPALGHDAGVIAWIPEEATVDPRQLVDALTAGLVNRRVELRANCDVRSLLLEGQKCRGIMADGERIEAYHTLTTAGSFSGSMKNEIARYAPTHPVRGQMLAMRHEKVKLAHVLRSKNGYLVPRPDGRIIAGSTLENAGFGKQVTAGGLRKILSAAIELVPTLTEAEILESWSGLRPGSPDELPILGPTDIEGLLVATGHYRNGILLAPVTAKLVCEWITTGRSGFNAEAFSPLRFQKSQPAAKADSLSHN